MKDFSTVSNKALEASYAVAKFIAKTKQPYTISKSLVLACCREIVKVMIYLHNLVTEFVLRHVML